MKAIKSPLAIIVAASLLVAACAGTPASLGTRVASPLPSGNTRTITGEACGFQLLLLIPIVLNSRLDRAYSALQAQAAGDTITDVEVRERWTYAYIGTVYCTTLRAKAVRSS